ncbi:hypothetical protein [Desulfofundulus thermosubterraneus]|nr:hypothetical protein [Desulfofundulus thermosubterraneus]
MRGKKAAAGGQGFTSPLHRNRRKGVAGSLKGAGWSGMRRNLALLLALFFIFVFTIPAFAVGSFTAVRNEDGSVTLKWSGGETGKKLTIQRTVGDKGIGYSDLAEVPQTDGSYTDRTADRNTTYTYRLHYGIGAFTNDVTVGPYSPGKTGPEAEQQNGPSLGEYTPGPFETVLALPIEGLSFFIEKLFGLTPVNELIYNHNGSGEKVIAGAGPFDKEDWERLMWWYALAAGFTGVLMFLSFVASGYRVMVTAAANPSRQADAKSDLLYIMMALFITLSAPLLFQILAGVNDGIVDFFYAASADKIGHLPDPMSISTGYSGCLGGALVRLAFVGVMLYLNFLYIIRKFVLAAILVLTPFFAFAWATGRNPQAIGVWLGELTSNVFMQAAHAVVLSLYFTIFAQESNTRFWVPIVALVALIPIAEVVRNLLQGFLKFLGVPEEKWAGKVLGAMTGMGAVAGLIGLGIASLGGRAGKVTGGTVPGGSSGGVLPGGMTPAGIPGGGFGGPIVSSPGGNLNSGGVPGGDLGGPIVPPSSGVLSSPESAFSTKLNNWEQRPSGLYVPAGTASRETGPGDSVSGTGAAPAGAGSPSLASDVHHSQSVGGKVADIAGKLGGAFGGLGAPGMGQLVGGLVSATTGAGTRMAMTTFNAIKGVREIRRSLDNNASLGEALQQYTGADSTWKAAIKITGAVTLSTVGAGHWAANWGTKRQGLQSRSINS